MIVIALFSVALAAKLDEPIAIVSSNSEMNADGSYTYA